jgi:hypothetical protein
VTDENFALKVARASHRDLDDAITAIEVMEPLGYSFVTPGTPGRMLVNTDQLCALARYLANKTRLEFRCAFDLLDGIAKLGFQIREPDVHPSGLRTNAYAHERVVSGGAAHAAASKTVERSGVDGFRVEIPNR